MVLISSTPSQQSKEENNRKSRWHITVSFLEQGNIYFFYKPKKGKKVVESFDDVGRFYFVLQPDGDVPVRFIVLGSKKMPLIDENGGTTGWGMVQKVGGRGFRTNKPDKEHSGAARPIGEGIYAFARHADHTHFLYTIELPNRLGEVQQAFRIVREANYIIAVKPSPGLYLPNEQSITSGNKFTSLTAPYILNYERSEILLTAGKRVISSMGVSFQKDRETVETADIFSQLQVSKVRHPVGPLLFGTWR